MQAIDEALMTLLKGDATLMALVEGVYNTAAPDDEEAGLAVDYPLVVFQQVSSVDDYTLSARVRTSYLYQVRVVDKDGDREGINDALDRIEALLMDTEIVAGATLYCRREGHLPYMAEMDSGVMYQQVGATYRIEVG